MQSQLKNFGSLTIEEQNQKIIELNNFLKENGFDNCKAKIMDQIVCPLKAPTVQRQVMLMADGNVNFSQKDTISKLKKDAYNTVLAGINPKTVDLNISSSLKVGDNF